MPTSLPRVLLISARSDIGGGPKYMVDFANALLSREPNGMGLPKENLFIAAPDSEPFGPQFKALAFETFILQHRSFSIQAFFRLLSFVRKNRISVLHSHGRGAGLYSRLFKLFGYRVAHSFHGIHQHPSVLGRAKLTLDRLLHRLTDEFVFVSESERQEAIRVGLGINQRYSIIHPLAPEPWLKSPPNYHHPLRLGCIARFDHQKGLDLLFKHLSVFKEMHPSIEWTFHLAGGFPKEGGNQEVFQIPNRIRENIKLLGPTLHPIDFLRTLDIYISASRWEGLPITILEAISQGLPVFISNVRGHEYFIQAGVALGFESEDPSSFSDELIKLIQNGKPDPHYDWITLNHRSMNVAHLYQTSPPSR